MNTIPIENEFNACCCSNVFSSRSRLRSLSCLMLLVLVGCSKTPIAKLAEGLEDPDHDVRYDTLKEIEDFGPGAFEVVPALAETLSDPSPKVRYRSAKVLSKIGIGAAPAAPQIVIAIQDKTTEEKTLYYLVKTLTNIEDSSIVAINELTEILEGKYDAKTRY